MPGDLHEDPHIQQLVSKTLMATVMSAVEGQLELSSAAAQFVSRLTDEGENIIRYAAGYVPFALLKKHKKSFGKKRRFTECLSRLAVGGASDSSFLEYGKQLDKICKQRRSF